MTQNKLKLNDTKTEVLIIVPPSQCSKYTSMNIQIADAVVETATSAKSLGISFDRNMTMKTEIVNRCRNLLYHLRNIRTIRQYITQNACEQLVHALISSSLDYANSMVGLPKGFKMCWVQTFQNNCCANHCKNPEIWSHHSHTTFTALVTSRILSSSQFCVWLFV